MLPILVREGDHNLLGGTVFGSQFWSGGLILAATFGPGGPLLGGTEFRVTGRPSHPYIESATALSDTTLKLLTLS